MGALLATGAVAAGGMLGDDSGNPAVAPTALVVDAAAARDGHELVNDRLEHAADELRLPRNAAEARSNVRYFDALEYRVVVAGRDAVGAAAATGIPSVRAASLAAALEAAER
jgi:hypothetical protein